MNRGKIILSIFAIIILVGCQQKDRDAQKEKMQNRINRAIDEQYHEKKIKEIEDLYEEKNKDLEEKFQKEKNDLDDRYKEILPSQSTSFPRYFPGKEVT